MKTRFIEKHDGVGESPYVETFVLGSGRIKVKVYYDISRLPRKGVETVENHELAFFLEPDELACIAGTLAGALAESRDKVVERATQNYSRFEDTVVALG